MLFVVLSGFITALFAPALVRVADRHAGLALATLPASLFVWFLTLLPEVNQAPIRSVHEWVPSLGIQLSFWLDGLSLLMALLITGIGTLIFIYAGTYLKGHQDLGRFFVFLLSFMAAMLGLVLSDNLISLFVFWELTSITSFMLIGFSHTDANARRCAMQGLYVTVGGGLVLMAGFIVFASMGGSYELSELLQDGDLIRDHGLYTLALLLILCGAFTKSAQFPFHFWLPNAMAAPTPVSAYLHSATMVKAGIYLLARLNPGFGGTELWTLMLCGAGGITMLMGIFLAARHTGIKKVLAYSTIMALGTLTMLIGIGSDTAIIAAMTFLLAHSLYKGALFMIAGIIDHEAGSKDFATIEGLRHVMPLTALAAGLAALSLAGVFPFFGFVAKELLFESSLGSASTILMSVTVMAAILVVAVACLVGIKPWFGRVASSPKAAHEAPLGLLLGPALLAILSLVFGLQSSLVSTGLIDSAASAVAGSALQAKLALWHGVNTALMISLVSLIVGYVLYRQLDRFRAWTNISDRISNYGPEAAFDRFMEALVQLSKALTSFLQNGYLRFYLITILCTMLALVGSVFVLRDITVINFAITDLLLHEAAILLVLVMSVATAVFSRSRLASVAALGAIGFTVALLYVLFSAPDVSITQILVETLTVILLVLVLYKLPAYLTLSPTKVRIRDAVIALLTGLTMTLLILATTATRHYDSITDWFIEASVPLGEGRNIVNVILVDFRAFDTLGEIFVLTLAAIGVFAMIRFRSEDRKA
ncbi:MAG: putative monovalent cation/H+ antiporter subunit A [Moraxellaceae bacterium]|nr:putative monovalent cation/H+ antiporter subunit A [Moraxellaceae bacterium]